MCVSIWERRYIQKEYKPDGTFKLSHKKEEPTKNFTVKFIDANGDKYNVIDGKLSNKIVKVIVPINKMGDLSLYQHFKRMDADINCNFVQKSVIFGHLADLYSDTQPVLIRTASRFTSGQFY